MLGVVRGFGGEAQPFSAIRRRDRRRRPSKASACRVDPRGRPRYRAFVVVVVDNYDSFTFNLVQYLAELGAEVRVFRNDAIDLAGIEALAPSGVLVGPGPGRPDESGVSLDVIRSGTR
ncbi:MAG: hypothetical protein KC586_31135, partial [Myxococcales bacterium]|nr:hypothetical protein [Myxococcales bacterium]